MSIASMSDPQQPLPIPRRWFLGLGIVLILTGIGALLFPLIVSLSISTLVGLTLLVGGISTVVHAFQVKGWRGFALEVLLGLIYITGGFLFLFRPFAGVFTLTAMLGAFFIVDGIARAILALGIRPDQGWVPFLLSGLLSLVLGVLIFTGLPSGMSLSFLGTLTGLNMLLTGVSFLFCANALRR